jgi:hypothetical protein
MGSTKTIERSPQPRSFVAYAGKETIEPTAIETPRILTIV